MARRGLLLVGLAVLSGCRPDADALTVAVVQGLEVPTVSYGAGFGPPSERKVDNGWRQLDRAATFSLTHDDPSLRRAQIVVQGRGTQGASVVRLKNAARDTIAQVEFGTHPTQVTLGPFALPAGTTDFTLEVDPATTGDVSVSPFLVQPLADYTDSLRAE